MAGDYADVSAVAKLINPGEGLIRWANQQGLEGRPLNRARRSSEGTQAHAILQRLTRDGVFPDAAEHYETPLWGPVVAMGNWYRSGPREFLDAERRLKSTRRMLVGRCDYVRACRLPHCPCRGSGGVLGDLKTGGLTVYIEAHYQVAGYRSLWEEVGLMPTICRGEVLAVDGRGNFRVVPAVATPEQFDRLFAVWQDVQSNRALMEALND